MTPALRHPRPGCALTDSPDWGGGHGGHLYPAGRVCATDGCGTVLRRTNPGPLCGPCQTRDGGASASAHGEAVTNAAPVPRHEQEANVNGVGRRKGKDGVTRAAILEHVRERGRCTVADVASAVGVKKPSARFHLDNLAAAGLIERPSDPAGKVMEWRPVCWAAEPEPETDGRDSAACDTDPAEAAESQSEAVATPPFAGGVYVGDGALDSTANGVWDPCHSFIVHPGITLPDTDPETALLARVVQDMARLDRDAQVRVASYIGARYL